ncbi:MAG: hypothetical protein J6B01_04730 [Ruminococcus sp.]|nr:hypothetical protein [Ruminococcus sp.]
MYVIKRKEDSSINNDELMHYKYTRKERKNGKWRYYYDAEATVEKLKDLITPDETINNNDISDKNKSLTKVLYDNLAAYRVTMDFLKTPITQLFTEGVQKGAGDPYTN